MEVLVHVQERTHDVRFRSSFSAPCEVFVFRGSKACARFVTNPFLSLFLTTIRAAWYFLLCHPDAQAKPADFALVVQQDVIRPPSVGVTRALRDNQKWDPTAFYLRWLNFKL